MSTTPPPAPAAAPAPAEPTSSSIASSTAPSTSTFTSSPTTVFAPRPLRLPLTYLPHPHRGLLSQVPRTPSPKSTRRTSRSGSVASAASEDDEQMARLYSPSPTHDVLDDFLKLVREGGTTLARMSPKRTERASIPASPVSRNLTRNPMIYNSQFGLVSEEG